MRPDERIVAGLSCSDVMEDLSAFLDGDLPVDRREAIGGHVSACALCGTFGEEFATMLAAAREQLGTPDQVPVDVETRLATALVGQRDNEGHDG